MTTAVKIIVSTTLDDETLDDITMLRHIRLEHYENMARNPLDAMAQLKSAGLKQESTLSQLRETAMEKIRDLKFRLNDPTTIYEDEMSLYVSSLNLENN